jgi:hypothetical protein
MTNQFIDAEQLAFEKSRLMPKWSCSAAALLLARVEQRRELDQTSALAASSRHRAPVTFLSCLS